MQSQENDVHKMMFMHLVSMLAMSAIQQMGKLVNPATGKAETNLEAAQLTIDMLDMVAAKTRGNLDPEETKLLQDTLMSLKMNFVESQEAGGSGQQTSNAQRPTPNAEFKTKEETGKAAEGKGQATDAGLKTGTETPAGEEKAPKYHKKYE